jgi:hypothetical protein
MKQTDVVTRVLQQNSNAAVANNLELETWNLELFAMPRARLELARLSTLDPKSSASANFATSAQNPNFKSNQLTKECLGNAKTRFVFGELSRCFLQPFDKSS